MTIQEQIEDEVKKSIDLFGEKWTGRKSSFEQVVAGESIEKIVGLSEIIRSSLLRISEATRREVIEQAKEIVQGFTTSSKGHIIEALTTLQKQDE